MRRRDRDGRAAEEAVLRLVQDHAADLLRFARRFSYCADDAHDAYQRSLEILVRRMRVDPPAQPLPWLRTVLRHESLAIRAQRDRHVSRFELDFDHHESRELEDPAERAVGQERIGHAAEALRRLKPQELTALVLRAEGLTYRQICDRTGWSYTRCNRAVYEGRRALAERLHAIESGAECERWAPLLSALADGEASAAALAELRPHLRACAGCRATLRGFHAAPAEVAALVPVALLPVAERGGSLLDHAGLALHALAERATLVATRVQGGLEGATGTKVAAVAASTAAIAGGGAAIEHATGGGERARDGRAPVVASAGAASSLTGAAGLARLAGPALPAASPRSSAPRSRRTGARHEFAPPGPARPSEFTPHAAPAEFASAGRATAPPGVSAAPGASAAATVSAAPPPVSPSAPVAEAPSFEFGGP